MIKEIVSAQNPFIKELVQLKEKSRNRKKSNTFLIEGIREIELAIKGFYSVKTILVAEEICDVEKVSQFQNNNNQPIEIIKISVDVYTKLAHRNTTEGVLAIAVGKELSLDKLKISNANPLILVAEAPEKPGNIGALLRTADAAGIDAVLIANPKTDMFNPNIIRSSVGCVFTVPIATDSSENIIAYLKQKKINLYGAALSASVPYQTIDYTQPSAIVVGTEDTGLTSVFLQNTTKNILIPMHGEIDSMNVSVSAAILIFEAVRQRNLINN